MLMTWRSKERGHQQPCMILTMLNRIDSVPTLGVNVISMVGIQIPFTVCIMNASMLMLSLWWRNASMICVVLSRLHDRLYQNIPYALITICGEIIYTYICIFILSALFMYPGEWSFIPLIQIAIKSLLSQDGTWMYVYQYNFTFLNTLHYWNYFRYNGSLAKQRARTGSISWNIRATFGKNTLSIHHGHYLGRC